MSLFGDVVELFRGRTTQEAPKLAYGRVERVEGWRDYNPEPAAPGTQYMQWWLQEMWVRYEREWLSHYFPVVYSVVKLQFGHTIVELPSSLGRFEFADGADLENLQDSLRLNYAMIPPVPYNGGVVEVAAALVGVRNHDGLSAIVSAVSELGRLLAVPQLSAVVSMAGPVAKTLDSVLGQGSQKFQLGLHQSYRHGGQEELREGYYIAAWHDGALDLNEFVVNGGRLAWAADPNRLVREFDYMLFRLELSTERDDLEGLTDIFGSMHEAEKAAIAGRLDEAAAWVQKAGLAAFHSVDLTTADRKRIPGALRERFSEFLQINGVAGSVAAVADRSTDLKELLAQVSVDGALGMSDTEVIAGILDNSMS